MILVDESFGEEGSGKSIQRMLCPLKVRKITIYCFFISFLVPSKDLKNYHKNGTKNVWS